MAKIYGLNGVLRGRQGNNVFSVQNGTQVVKAYQPVVANPRTFLQSVQRAKFALAGKMSSIVPSEAIVGLPGASPRARRADFVSGIARAATTTSTPSGGGTLVTASIVYGSVRFSEGNLSAYAAHSSFTASYGGTAQQTTIRATLSGFTTDPISADAPEGYGELAIVCLFNSESSRLDACQCKLRTNEAVTFDFAFARTPAHAVLYIVPFAPVGSASRYGALGFLGDSTTAVLLNMLSSASLSGMRFGSSFVASMQTLTPPTNMVAPTDVDDTRKRK